MMNTRSVAYLALVGFLALGSSPAFSQGYSKSDFEDLIQQGKEIRERGQTAGKQDLLGQSKPGAAVSDKREAYRQEGRSMLRKRIERFGKSGNRSVESQCGSADTVIAVSYSLGQSALKSIMEDVSGHDSVMMVMRGVPEGQKIGPGVRQLQRLARTVDPMPSVTINPTLFRDHGIQKVPTMLRIGNRRLTKRGCEYDVMARVSGITNPQFLDRRIEMGDQGNLGQRGPIKEIAEPDLIKVMKKRMAQISWQQKIDGAKDRIWDNQRLVELPKAKTNRTRKVSAEIVATADIKDSKGNVLVAKGERVNQLDVRDWTTRLIIFDSTSEKQISVAEREIVKAKSEGYRPILMISDIDRDNGFKTLDNLSQRLGHRIYLLAPDTVQRFRVERTPTVISATDRDFVVEEIGMEETNHPSNTGGEDG